MAAQVLLYPSLYSQWLYPNSPFLTLSSAVQSVEFVLQLVSTFLHFNMIPFFFFQFCFTVKIDQTSVWFTFTRLPEAFIQSDTKLHGRS